MTAGVVKGDVHLTKRWPPVLKDSRRGGASTGVCPIVPFKHFVALTLFTIKRKMHEALGNIGALRGRAEVTHLEALTASAQAQFGRNSSQFGQNVCVLPENEASV